MERRKFEAFRIDEPNGKITPLGVLLVYLVAGPAITFGFLYVLPYAIVFVPIAAFVWCILSAINGFAKRADRRRQFIKMGYSRDQADALARAAENFRAAPRMPPGGWFIKK